MGVRCLLQRYKWRHDGVLRGLRDTFRKAAGESWHVFADVDNTAVEPHSQRWFGSNGVSTTLRPDILLVKEKDGEVAQVVVVELSCVWEADGRKLHH